MTENERKTILASLEHGSTALHEALGGVSDEQAVLVPSEKRWSILQCVEHVGAAEDFLFFLIAGAQTADAPMVNTQRETMILARGADRGNKRESPAAALPQGRFTRLQDALEGFRASRARTIEFVNAHEGDLRARFTVHPLMGPLNCHEILLLMAVHPERHAGQIEEIKAAVAG